MADAGAETAAEQAQVAVGAVDFEVEAFVLEEGEGGGDAVLDGVAGDAGAVLLEQALAHLADDQLRQFAAVAAGGLVRGEGDDLLEQAVGDADVVVREEFAALFGQRKDVARTAGAASDLGDRDVVVAEEDIEVATNGGAREPELAGEIVDGCALRAPQDVEDLLARAFDASVAVSCHHHERRTGFSPFPVLNPVNHAPASERALPSGP